MSRLVNELLQKDAEVEKTKNEVDALRNDNAVSCTFFGAGVNLSPICANVVWPFM